MKMMAIKVIHFIIKLLKLVSIIQLISEACFIKVRATIKEVPSNVVK